MGQVQTHPVASEIRESNKAGRNPSPSYPLLQRLGPWRNVNPPAVLRKRWIWISWFVAEPFVSWVISSPKWSERGKVLITRKRSSRNVPLVPEGYPGQTITEVVQLRRFIRDAAEGLRPDQTPYSVKSSSERERTL